jgi:Zn finger protein HypA/HybF involved in hydrogenase expression
VLVGSIEYGRIWVAQEKAHVAVRINANVVEAGVRTFLKQELTFRRPLHVITRPPEKVLDLGCPNCGSPEEPKLDGSCPSCGSITGGGELDWQVVQISTHERAPVGPPVGSKGGAEVGTDLPTRYAMDLAAQKRALAMRDPAFQWLAFANRVKHMFMTLQDAWTNLDDKKVRPFVTDTHFDMIRYWIERMRSSGRRDVLEDVRIQRIEIAKIEHDVWYDAITVRIFASMIDYQVDNTGRVVSGRKGAQRAFSEYWTVIRRSDQAHTAARDPASCPSCGAPLDKINRAGICEYCGSKVVSGNFDWVLSIITQDEEYRG